MWKRRLLILIAAVIAYIPAVNNGFIADDYVILHRVELLKADPLYLNQVAPENFRLTSYLVFMGLKAVFGYDSRPFYLFAILVHALNCLLLYEIVFQITGNREVSLLSGLFFAVFQAPQEAVMWLAAMNETLSGLFLFLTLLLWLKSRYAYAASTFFVALFSKESALIFVLLLPLIDFYRGRQRSLKTYGILAIPTVLFIVPFLSTLSTNFQIGNGTYAVGPHVFVVLFKSLHRLFWPWGYIAVALLLWLERARLTWKAALWAGLIPVSLLPYMFVTYTRNIPSRQVYLASAMFLPLLARGLLWIGSRGWRVAFVGAFLAFNVVYMWTRKDAQMLERAMPTTALVEELARHSPKVVRIRDFADPYPEIARAAAMSLPGWRWGQVDVGDSCTNCLLLQWDGTSARYSVSEVPAVP